MILVGEGEKRLQVHANQREAVEPSESLDSGTKTNWESGQRGFNYWPPQGLAALLATCSWCNIDATSLRSSQPGICCICTMYALLEPGEHMGYLVNGTALSFPTRTSPARRPRPPLPRPGSRIHPSYPPLARFTAPMGQIEKPTSVEYRIPWMCFTSESSSFSSSGSASMALCSNSSMSRSLAK